MQINQVSSQQYQNWKYNSINKTSKILQEGLQIFLNKYWSTRHLRFLGSLYLFIVCGQILREDKMAQGKMSSPEQAPWYHLNCAASTKNIDAYHYVFRSQLNFERGAILKWGAILIITWIRFVSFIFVQILDGKLVVSKNSIIKNYLQWASGNVQSGHGEVNNVGVWVVQRTCIDLHCMCSKKWKQ